MNSKFVALAVVLCGLSASTQAQSVYGGVGLPGLYTIGYSAPVDKAWNLRGEYAGGLSMNKDGNRDGVDMHGSLKANRAGVFADWFAFDSGFRFVGGVTANDIKADLVATGTAGTTINGKTVNMTGHYYNVNVKYPSTSAYLGLGYGHNRSASKGFDFYADVGVSLAKFKVDASTDLVGVSGITQTDVDTQTQKVRDSVSKISVLPSFSIGAVYRF